jgi:hypothetical protein
MKKILLIMFVTLMLSPLLMTQQKLWTVLTNGGTVNSSGNGTYGIIMVYDPSTNVWSNKLVSLKQKEHLLQEPQLLPVMVICMVPVMITVEMAMALYGNTTLPIVFSLSYIIYFHYRTLSSW